MTIFKKSVIFIHFADMLCSTSNRWCLQYFNKFVFKSCFAVRKEPVLKCDLQFSETRRRWGEENFLGDMSIRAVQSEHGYG